MINSSNFVQPCLSAAMSANVPTRYAPTSVQDLKNRIDGHNKVKVAG